MNEIEKFLKIVAEASENEPGQWFWVGDEESYQRFLKKVEEWKSVKNRKSF